MRPTLLLALIILAAGCATNATRESALLLIDQTDAYEVAINAKLKAEQRFYAQTISDLEDTASRQARRTQQAEYLNTLTQMTDQAVVRDKGLQLSLLQHFLREANESGRTAEAERIRREAELRETYRINFETLTFHRRQLAKVRSQLLNLTRERQTRQQLIQFLEESAGRALAIQQESSSDSTE